MKTLKNSLTPRLSHISRIKLLTLAAALVMPAATGLAQTMWTDGTADYNIPGNWNGTYNDGSTVNSPNPNCDNDTGSNNIILIQPGDPAWYHGDTLAGQGNGTSGAYLQTGSTNFTGWPDNGNWLRMGIGSGTYGSYVLSNGVVFVAGQTHLGEHGTGYLEVDGGVYNTGYNGNPGICAGDGDFGVSSGTLVLTGGTLNNINNETWFGEANSACTGYLIMSGGIFNANNWFVFGRNGGVGYGVMTGGILNFTGGGNFLVGGGGSGTLIQSGGTINAFNQYLVPQSGNTTTDTGTNVLSGTAVLDAHDWIAIGRDGGYGELDISGGASITRDNANDGGAFFTVGSGGPGVVNQNGGAISNLASATFIGEAAKGTWNLNSGIADLGNVIFVDHPGANGTFNLNGGLLQASSISVGTNNGVSTFNFNGGTLQATASNPSFFSGLTLAFAGPSPAVIDSQSYNIGIGQEIDDNGGGLVKLGSGTLTLTGPNTYSGNTVVSNGTLIVASGSSASGSYIVQDGTTFGVTVASSGGQLDDQQNLTLGNSAGVALDFNLGNFGNPGSAPLTVGQTVTANGTITINVADTFPQVGQFPLIQAGNALAGSGTYVLGSLPTGVTAHLVVSANAVSLDITVVNLPVWAGLAGGTWDLESDTNWYNLGTGLPTTFANGNAVLFNDTAPGTTSVNLSTTVNPGSTTVNNTNLSYTFYGSGSISGSGGLTKSGPNSLSILNPAGNSYTGPTILAGGTLIVSNLANGGSPSAIGSSSGSAANLVLGGGTLTYNGPAVSINRGYAANDTNGAIDIVTVSNLTLSGSVTDVPGSGFNKSGAGQLAYANTGVNVLSDVLGYNVDQGTVAFNSGTENISGNLNIFTSNSVPVVNVAGATVNLLTGGTLDIADSQGSIITNYGTVNLSGGVINVGGGYSTFVGQNSNSVGVLNISGGAYNANNWIAIGRDNGFGTVNLSGTGALNMVNGNGGNLDIGNSGGFNGQNGTAVLNQSGGTVSNIVSGTWLGEGSGSGSPSGTWNMTGGTAWLGYLGIGYNGSGIGSMSISGNASVLVNNSPCEIGRQGTGTLTIGSTNGTTGTLTLNSGNDFNVGNNGNGVLNMLPGGTVSTLGTMYLTRGNNASGYVYLNSGSKIITGYLNNGAGFGVGVVPATNAEAFYFNGGVLQAATGSPYFIQPYVDAIIGTNGAVIDDGGFSITALNAFADGVGSTGGLTKLGAGTLILNAVSTYTGTTVVSNGTLQANGLAGGITVESGATLLSASTVAGPVTVASGGTLGGNSGIGTENFNNTLTLAAGSTTFAEITPASNDQIAGLTGVTYGGSLIVSNISSSPLTAGSEYQLFHSSSPGSGNFTSVTLLPVGTATFNPTTGILTITSSGAAPTFNRPYLSGGNLVVTAAGGTPGANLVLLSSTNLLTPLPQWTTNYSGMYDSNGNFSNNIPVNAANRAVFFILKP
jgi:autotransporter-associated beta strand protein/T5SS/PEP-CTERM-associated repeat protein